MKNNSFKITSLLYVSILLLPALFYYTFVQLHSVQQNFKVIRELGMSGNSILILSQTKQADILQKKIETLDTDLTQLHAWFAQNDYQKFYVGTATLLTEYTDLMKCWQNMKTNLTEQNTKACLKKINSLTFIIEKMSSLKIENTLNMLYITLAAAILLFMLLIFLIREYIRHQLEKESIRDTETGLFNHDYYFSTLAKLCAQADRKHHSLSAIIMQIPNIDLLKKRYPDLPKELGDTIHKNIRTSDYACRYSHDTFVILLPHTDANNSVKLWNRLTKHFKENLYQRYPDVSFDLKYGAKEENGSCNPFVWQQ